MAKTPKIRFKNFSDEWVEHKLGDYFTERVERSNIGELISVTINSGIRKFYELGRHDNSSDDKSNYKRVEIDDIAYNSMRMWQGASGRSPYSGILSPAYTVIIPKEGINSVFFSYVFKLPNMIYKFKIHSQGLTTDTWNLKFPAFAEIEASKPTIAEQCKISEFFTKLDKLIALHQSKFEKLQKIKKSCLQNLFPQNNQNTPKIRFKNFSDDWVENKLEKIANRFDNLRIPISANKRISGSIPYYGANGIQDYVKGYTHNGEFILIAEDGANDLKNYPVQYVNGKFWANNHTHVVQAITEIANNKFLKYAISQINIERILVGGGRAKLNANAMMDLCFNIPNLTEQEKIGAFFSKLDKLISLHQSKFEKLQKIKKSCLQNMFV